jgi:two-component system response regulator RegX3
MGVNPAGRLLLVEDETVLRGLVSQFLVLEDFEVVAAEDGQAAVEAYEDGGPFDLVLLDLNLPVLSGVEACRRIKEIHADQPFLVCSAAILDSHIAALEALGVTESLGKPYHPLELLTRIRAIMASAGTRAASDRERDPKTWRNDPRQAGGRPVHALSEAHVFD